MYYIITNDSYFIKLKESIPTYIIKDMKYVFSYKIMKYKYLLITSYIVIVESYDLKQMHS